MTISELFSAKQAKTVQVYGSVTNNAGAKHPMITLEDYEKMVSGETETPTDDQKALAKKIFDAVEEDVKGLKATNVQLKVEKNKMKEAHEADINKFAEAEKKLQEELKAAQEQVKANSPEDARKYYDQQLSVFETGMKAQLAERDSKIAALKATVQDYEHKDLLRSQEVEFERLVRKTNADPAAYDTIKTMVLGGGNRFNVVNTAEGNVFLATDGSGKSIGNTLDEFLASSVGKRLCNINSSGAGAEGGVKMDGGMVNPFKRETWNETEQMKLYKSNPSLARQLEASAGNKV